MITVYPTSQQHAMLEELVCIGNYGSTSGEIVEYLLRRGLDDLLRSGVLSIQVPMLQKKRKARQ